MHTTELPVKGFDVTGISPVILSIINRAGLTTPTPIQEKAIPVALTGVDIIGIAQTGTGKTLAFSLPLMDRLLTQKGKALVIVPTRELAVQVEESVRNIARYLNPSIRTVCLIGGAPIYRQTRDLRSNPRIIIATPGRLQDHLNQGNVNLSDVITLVLDEADRMLDMGFAPQIKQILTSVPADHQTMLFSATMPPEIERLTATYMQNPVRIEVAKAGSNNQQITQELCYVGHEGKSDLLQTYLKDHEGSVLVFSRTKHGASKLAKKVQTMGHSATEIHSNRSQGQRRQALEGFKSGKFRVLVATDVAARGIDVSDIAVVVNYDLPDNAEDYVHRIGRTGRAGKTGIAVSFATHDQRRDVKTIERVINRPLPLSAYSETPLAAPAYAGGQSSRGGRTFNKQRSSGGGGWQPRSSTRPFSKTRSSTFRSR